MSILERIPFLRKKEFDLKKEAEYSQERIGQLRIPENLTDQNAFILANSVAEIFWPIDFHSDRASKLRFYISKNGKEIVNTELNRFIGDKINPFYSFSDLFYQAVFSYLASGNIIAYPTRPSAYDAVLSASNINRIDILSPDSLRIDEFTSMSILKANSLNSLIKKAQYCQSYLNEYLEVENLVIKNIDSTRQQYSNILSKSPLFKCQKSIDTLLSVYSARFNVYANNGFAGYLVKKSSANQNGLADIVNDPINRDSILKDINERGGLTGKRHLWGISSVPLEFINTLVSIKDLLPLEETLENSIKIASVYQIPPGLVPRKDGQTFDNQGVSEKTVWENSTKSIVQTVCELFTKAYRLDVLGYSIGADYSGVSAFEQNEDAKETSISKRLDNLKKIKDISPEKTDFVNSEIDKILNGYGKEN